MGNTLNWGGGITQGVGGYMYQKPRQTRGENAPVKGARAFNVETLNHSKYIHQATP